MHKQAVAVAEDLLDFCTKFQGLPHNVDSTNQPTENDLALAKLCSDCNHVAQVLLGKLERLMPNRPAEEKRNTVHKFKTNLRLALLTISSKRELMDMESQLEQCRTAVHTRILGCLL